LEKEAVDDFWRIWEEEFEFLVNAIDSKNSVSSNVGVSVLQVALNGRNQRFDELGLLQFADVTKSGASDVLVGMIEIVSQEIASREEMNKKERLCEC